MKHFLKHELVWLLICLGISALIFAAFLPKAFTPIIFTPIFFIVTLLVFLVKEWLTAFAHSLSIIIIIISFSYSIH